MPYSGPTDVRNLWQKLCFSIRCVQEYNTHIYLFTQYSSRSNGMKRHIVYFSNPQSCLFWECKHINTIGSNTGCVKPKISAYSASLTPWPQPSPSRLVQIWGYPLVWVIITLILQSTKSLFEKSPTKYWFGCSALAHHTIVIEISSNRGGYPEAGNHFTLTLHINI